MKLAILFMLVGTGTISAQSDGRCGAGDPTGYFSGAAAGHESGRLEVSLNLRCADGRYQGELVTPLGTFPVSGGSAESNRLQLVFAMGDARGTIDATSGLDTLNGSFAVPGDSGTLALSRTGQARAAGWNAITLDLPPDRWREDLVYFARELPALHGDAFHAIARSRFDSLVAALDQRLSSLNGSQMYVELDRLANLIGDAHTFISLPDDTPRFPFAVRRFGSEYRVTAVVRGNERILGTRLLKVENTAIPLAVQRLWSLTPADEHSSLRHARVEGFFSLGMMLHGLGLTRVPNSVTLTLADAGGKQFHFEVRAVPMNVAAVLPWRDVFIVAPLYAQNPGQSFWYRYLPDARTVYCSFRGYDSLPTRAAGLLALLGRVRPEKLVVDLRQNGGGDYTLGLEHLIEPLSRLSHLNRRGQLFVAIGANTFSAGMANAAQFRARTAAILVGEMIGEKPNSFQEPREMRLPNSHLIVRYSTRYYRFAENGPNAIRPDHEVARTWSEYQAGHDPVLEWILRR